MNEPRKKIDDSTSENFEYTKPYCSYPSGFLIKESEAQEMQSILRGLHNNDLLHYDLVLTGYCRSIGILHEIEAMIMAVKKKNPKIWICCDPVLGDDNKFYVPATRVEPDIRQDSEGYDTKKVETDVLEFKNEIPAYKNSKGAVQFPIDHPLPYSLIGKIVKFRLKEDKERAKMKAILKNKK